MESINMADGLNNNNTVVNVSEVNVEGNKI